VVPRVCLGFVDVAVGGAPHPVSDLAIQHLAATTRNLAGDKNAFGETIDEM